MRFGGTRSAGRLRLSAAWAVAIPLAAIGSQLAHALAYRLAYPALGVRAHVLAVTGHGYDTWLPFVLAVAAALAVGVLLWTSIDAARGGPSRPAPPLLFAFLPLLTFTLQELVERWLLVGGLPWWFVEQPTFRIGVLLQVPLGLAAFLAARVLLRGAHALGRRLRRPARPRLLAPGTLRFPAGAVRATPAPSCRAVSKRGPPLV